MLVNNAGITAGADFLEMTDAQWDLVLDVDLKGTPAVLTGVRAGDEEPGRRRRIVNISSVHEDVPFPGFAQYCAAKGGMRMLMRALSLELAPYKIRVNNIAPGAIGTPRNVARLVDPVKQQLITGSFPRRASARRRSGAGRPLPRLGSRFIRHRKHVLRRWRTVEACRAGVTAFAHDSDAELRDRSSRRRDPEPRKRRPPGPRTSTVTLGD